MTGDRLRILFVAGECKPYIKTGGLGDVAGALPAALYALGHDVRVLVPGYAPALAQARELGPVDTVTRLPGSSGERLLATRMNGGCPVWFHDTTHFRARDGNPYTAADGTPYHDNAVAFSGFSRLAARLAGDGMELGWAADVVHANDWHTGLVPVWMMLARMPAASIFTIHNLGFQGRFRSGTMEALGLPDWLYHWQALEHTERLSFMKGALVFADRVTTVSRAYAQEILEPSRGEGLDSVLRHRGDRLSGIVNGIDTAEWNPAADPRLVKRFSPGKPVGKHANREALLAETGLEADSRTAVIAWIGRLTEQKGADLLVEALPDLLKLPARVIILGAGDAGLEEALNRAALAHPGYLHVHTGFDEAFAHRLYAGADMLLMPSRFEPCGLAQLNAMRYGTIPIVHATGGLAETVTDATAETLAGGTATGFQFHEPSAEALVARCREAMTVLHRPRTWRKLITSAMRRDSSWATSAAKYARLYERARNDRFEWLD